MMSRRTLPRRSAMSGGHGDLLMAPRRLALMLGVAATLAAPALAAQVDQAGWAARKRHVAAAQRRPARLCRARQSGGPPLLLLHGFTDSSRVWTILAPYLETHRVLIPDQRGHADAEMVAVPPHVWRAVPRAFLDAPVGRYAADVRAPVLILSGGRDPLFPAEHHRSLIAAYPAAEAHVFPQLGHNLIVERPKQVGPVLAAFLARAPAGAGGAR